MNWLKKNDVENHRGVGSEFNVEMFVSWIVYHWILIVNAWGLRDWCIIRGEVIKQKNWLWNQHWNIHGKNKRWVAKVRTVVNINFDLIVGDRRQRLRLNRDVKTNKKNIYLYYTLKWKRNSFLTKVVKCNNIAITV